MPFLIYGLFSGIDVELRYVGKTINSLEWRLSKHLAENNDNYKCRWIKSENKNIYIQLIQELYNKEDLNNAEIYWIKYFRENGCKLTNLTDGGDGGTPGRSINRKFTDLEELEILKYYNQGNTLAKTGDNFDISAAGVLKILKRNNMKARSNLEVCKKLNDVQDFEILRLYDEGFSSYKLASLYGVSIWVILETVRRLGGTVRPRNYKFMRENYRNMKVNLSV